MSSTFKGNLFALILILIQFLGSIFVVPLLATIIPSYIGLLTFTQLLFLLTPVLFYFAITGESTKEVLSIRHLSFKSFCLVVLIALASQPVAWFLSYLSGLLFNNDVADLFGSIGIYPYWMLLIVLAVIPAVCEEVAIRGVVLHGYKREPILVASIITGLIFGMLHLNPQQFLYTSILGILFAYLVRITGSIFSGIIAHFVFNGFQVSMSKLSLSSINQNVLSEEVQFSEVTSVASALLILGVMAIIFILTIVFMLKRLKLYAYDTNSEIISGINEEEEIKNSSRGNLFNMPLIVLIIVFIGTIIFTYRYS